MTQNDTLLMVENDPAAIRIAMHAFMKSGIKKQRIKVAKDGQAALDILFGEAGMGYSVPRLILLDLKLPKINGLEVLKRIRKEPSTKGVPVIILTNSDEERDVEKGYNLGANSYLKKPIDFDQLIDILEQLGLMPK
ncbi:MAG: response regulator [Magnetococcales bacterium]|nr:response regulator [Magnetococcales bacterium]